MLLCGFAVCAVLLQEPAHATAAPPRDAVALVQKANGLLHEGRRGGVHELLIEAETLFVQAVVADPTQVAAHAGLAYARLGRHDFAGALSAARAALRLEPNHPALLALLGDVHFGIGNLVEAEGAWTLLIAQGESLASLARRGLLREARGDLSAAARDFEDALLAGELLGAPDAERAWCRSMLGELEAERGRWSESLTSFEASAVLDPESRFAALGRARALSELGRTAEAIPLLEALVERLPEPSHFIQLGETLERVGRAEEALALYERCAADVLRDFANKDFGHARELAELWLDHDGDPRAALELALRDLAEVRQDGGAWAVAAWAYQRCGDPIAAARHMDEALRAGGATTRTWHRAAEIYAAAGDRLRAARCAQIAEQRSSLVPAR